MVQIKIYPSNHSIEIINESKIDTDLKIPLAYINIDNSQYNIKTSVEPDFTKSEMSSDTLKIPILPNEEIEDEDDLTFNEFEEPVDIKPHIKPHHHHHHKKCFIPHHHFIPYKFWYRVIARKNMVYNTNKRYNIKVACYDDSDSLDLSMRLSQIFANPAERGLITSNIEFNNNKTDANTLIDMSFEDADFVFLETYDGKYLDKNKTEEVKLSNFLDNCVNVWVSCEDHYLYKHKNDDLGYATFLKAGAFKEFEIKRPMLSSIKHVQCNHYFNLSRPEYCNQSGKNLYNMFSNELSPVLIIEHIGKGFEIISHSEVLKEPKKYKNLIYEVMMYVYVMSYKKSKRVDEWISYRVPHYEIINKKLYTKTNFSSCRKLNDILELEDKDYSIYQIDVYDNNEELPVSDSDLPSTATIEFVDIVNNKLVFEMPEIENAEYTEVELPTGWSSIYSEGSLYYVDQIYYYIESDITNKLFVIDNIATTDSLDIKLYPFKSSKHHINLSADLTVTIPNITTVIEDPSTMIETKKVANEIYVLYIDKEATKLCYDVKSNYEEQDNRVKIAEIEISQTEESTFITDMRQIGGGLKEETKEDYNLLDMGHINGRPYRKSNTLIITMPKKYEQYKDKIMDALEKYKVGEDYPILFFEDEEE